MNEHKPDRIVVQHQEFVRILADLERPAKANPLLLAAARRVNAPHSHREYADGCFRCDLSRAES